ncbi:MAG: copper homeostasis protein CutC [Bacteroidota bacterium]|nr:copper homeostasis protein CutC [Bacteroidota bacterium]
MDAILEICADSFNSAKAAERGGAARIELCDNLSLGGTTPSYGVVKNVVEKLDIKCNVLIRPRVGDFVYSNDELNIMLDDIKLCKKLGVNGVVIGALTNDGDIDIDITRKMVAAAKNMEITFHRAFDITRSPLQEIENLKSLGIDRLLTSGQRKTAFDGKELIKQLVKKCGDVIIMPGSGINSNNIADIAAFTGAKEFHTSAKKMALSNSKHRKVELLMGEENGGSELRWSESNEEIVRQIVLSLKNI